MGEHHSSAAVSVEAQLVHRVAIRYSVSVILYGADELDITLIEVRNDLARRTGQYAAGSEMGLGWCVPCRRRSNGWG